MRAMPRLQSPQRPNADAARTEVKSLSLAETLEKIQKQP